MNATNVFRPHQSPAAHYDWKTTAEPWYHVDNPKPQPGPLIGQKVVFPGLLNLKAIDTDSDGFVCIPKSHKLFHPTIKDGDSETYLDLTSYNNYIDSKPNERVGNKVHTQPIFGVYGSTMT